MLSLCLVLLPSNDTQQCKLLFIRVSYFLVVTKISGLIELDDNYEENSKHDYHPSPPQTSVCPVAL